MSNLRRVSVCLMGSMVFVLFDLHFVSVFLLSFGVCMMVAIIGKRSPSVRSLFESRKSQVQALHVNAIPRLGSFGILSGYFLAAIYFIPGSQPLLALVPLVAVSFFEDFGLTVPPIGRLISVAGAATYQITVTLIWIDRIDFIALDAFFANFFLGSVATVVICTAVSHSFNLIDGINGLAAICAIAAASAMSWIAYMAGVGGVSILLQSLIFCVLGFLPVNFPKAHIFLGDTGAYFLGFILSWAGIMLLAAAPTVSPWAILLCVFWPVMDTIWSIVRRVLRRVPITRADREHMHHLAFRVASAVLKRTQYASLANPLATVGLTPFVVVPPLLAMFFWNNTRLCVSSIALLALSYVVAYHIILRDLERMERQVRT